MNFYKFTIKLLFFKCLGDQQSALVGQMCFQQGQAKNTYGTGCFLLYNTGTAVSLFLVYFLLFLFFTNHLISQIVQSNHGLLTTVAYKLGKSTPAVYALEGSVAVAGVALKWLRDNLGLLTNVAQSETMIQGLPATSEVVFVPAFSGLYAPYWRKDARRYIKMDLNMINSLLFK